MPAFPQFGGTNAVTELDVGQVGGTRRGANQARWTGKVLEGPDETASAMHTLPGQNVVFRGVEGFTGKRVRWDGVLAVVDEAMLGTIIDELNAKKHGGLTTPSPGELKETKLTSSSGRVLSERAVLEDWRFTGAVQRITGDEHMTLAVRLEIKFVCMG